MSRQQLTAENLAHSIAHFASDKKALDIVILDMRGIVNYCDFFVLCSGTSDRQAKAIADGIEEGLHQLDVAVKTKKGTKGSLRPRGFGVANDSEYKGIWMLLDMGDVVAHIFDAEGRAFYALEHLWHQAPRIEFSE